MQYIIIKNFKTFQHYQHRNIAWIKLHLQMLDNLDFWYFEDWEKWLWVGLLMLAGKLRNRIPYNHDYIRNKLALRTLQSINEGIAKFEQKKMIEIREIDSDGKYRQGIDTSIELGIAQIRGDKRRLEENRVDKSKIPTHKTADYLKNIPTEELEEFSKKFGLNKDGIIKAGEAAADYVASHGKRYKDYRAFLRNWLRNDFNRGGKELKTCAHWYNDTCDKACRPDYPEGWPDCICPQKNKEPFAPLEGIDMGKIVKKVNP